jgi:predicted metal-dependent peptidase
VCQHEKYERGEYEAMMSSTKPKGGGGTDASCVPNYLLEHKMRPECVIMLTDGYVSELGTLGTPCVLGYY